MRPASLSLRLEPDALPVSFCISTSKLHTAIALLASAVDIFYYGYSSAIAVLLQLKVLMAA